MVSNTFHVARGHLRTVAKLDVVIANHHETFFSLIGLTCFTTRYFPASGAFTANRQLAPLRHAPPDTGRQIAQKIFFDAFIADIFRSEFPPANPRCMEGYRHTVEVLPRRFTTMKFGVDRVARCPPGGPPGLKRAACLYHGILACWWQPAALRFF